MVFWYSIDERVGRTNVPKLDIDGKSYNDRLMYGARPWVVVSSEDICRRNTVVSVLPIFDTSEQKFIKDPAHIYLKFKGKDSVIVTEQIRSVNSIELQEYMCILEDDYLAEVDVVLANTLGINNVRNTLASTGSLESIENVIASIVEKRVSQALEYLPKADNVDIEDAAIRIAENLQVLFDTHEEQENKGVEDECNTRGSKTSITQAPVSNTPKNNSDIQVVRSIDEKYHRWTECEMIEFAHDLEDLTPEQLMKKYGCTSKKTLQQLKSRIMRKLGTNV